MQKRHDSTDRKRFYWQAKPNRRCLAIRVCLFLPNKRSDSICICIMWDECCWCLKRCRRNRQAAVMAHMKDELSNYEIIHIKEIFPFNWIECCAMGFGLSVLLLPIFHCKRHNWCYGKAKFRYAKILFGTSIRRVYKQATSSSLTAWRRKVRTQQLDSNIFSFGFTGNIPLKEKILTANMRYVNVDTNNVNLSRHSNGARLRSPKICEASSPPLPTSDRRRYEFFITAIRFQCRLQFLIFLLVFLGCFCCVQPMRKQRADAGVRIYLFYVVWEMIL